VATPPPLPPLPVDVTVLEVIWLARRVAPVAWYSATPPP
jgi:hypothetical protein